MTSSVITKRYAPSGAAKEVFKRREPELLLAGPAGTGKSRAALEKLHAMCIANPMMRGLMVRQTHVSLTSTGLVTFQEHVAKEDLDAGVLRWYGGSQSSPPAFIYQNGSTINVGGMDKPMKVMSSEYDVIYVQEATELGLEAWEALSSRLRNGRVSFQQIIADCNPAAPSHWLKRRCDAGKTVMLYSKHEDNPVLFEPDGKMTDRGQQYMTRLDNLTGVRYKRLRLGLWVAAEGMVYDTWNEQVNIIDKMPDGWETWPRYWSIDWGWTNPMVIQFWAVDHDGRGYLYREIYESKVMVEDMAKRVLRIVAPGGQWIEPQPQRILADHDPQDRHAFERHVGLPTQPAVKTVEDGLQAVATRMKPAGDGKPRLYLLRNALVKKDESLAEVGRPTSTLEEIPGYVWDQKEGAQPKEEPVKENDHGCDAMRYFVADQDLKPEVNLRWLGLR